MKKLVRVSLFVLMALTLSLAIGCKHDSDPEQKPASSNFEGEWMSTDGEATVTIKDGNFTTKVGEQQQELKGTYTVSGTTLTTSEFTLPQEFDGQKMKFTMKLKDGESDVMDLPLSKKLGGNKILVKKSTEEVDLTGIWTGKVNGGAADGTIEFAYGVAHLTVGNDTVDSTLVGQDKNFFTIRWPENNNLKLTESTTCLVSVSGKAYLWSDWAVFTRSNL